MDSYVQSEYNTLICVHSCLHVLGAYTHLKVVNGVKESFSNSPL